MINFACDQCGKKFQVPDAQAGRTGKCQQCGARIRIPDVPAFQVDEEGEEVDELEGVFRRAVAPLPIGETKFCHHCGATIAKPAEICPKCGVRQHGIAAKAEPKSKTTAALLAIFLGGLGLHRFYLGQTTAGVIYIVSFLVCVATVVLFFLPALVGLIEGIILLTMTDEAFAEKYGKT